MNVRPALLTDFALRIGQRASLVPSPGGRVYGMLISLTRVELERLYGAPGLEGYVAEKVIAQTLEGEDVPALCYVLVRAPEHHERNPEYALRLRQVLDQLGFPRDYVESVK